MEYESYLYPSHRHQYDLLMGRKLEKKDRLRVVPVTDAYVLPAKPAAGLLFGAGGILDQAMRFVPESAILTRAGVTSYPEPEKREYETYMGNGYDIRSEKADYHDKEVVFLGYMHDHWGHFLVDFSTRLWYVLQAPPETEYICTVDLHGDGQLHPNILRFLELLGLNRNNLTFVNEVTQYRKVLIPECAYQTNSYCSDEYLKVFDAIAERISRHAPVYDHVYFTRCRYGKAAQKELGEKEIEKCFRDNGYRIVSPEQCSLDELVWIIRNAGTIAGVNGSVTHNMLFARNGQTLYILNKTYIKNVVQCDVNLLRHLRVSYVDSFKTFMPVSMGFGPFLLMRNAHFMEFADAHGLTVHKRPSPLSDNRKRYVYIKKYERQLAVHYRKVPYRCEPDSVHFYDPVWGMQFTKNLLEAKMQYSLRNLYRRIKKMVRSDHSI